MLAQCSTSRYFMSSLKASESGNEYCF